MRKRATWALALLAASMIPLAGAGEGQANDNFTLVPTIAFSSVRDIPCVRSLPVAMQPSAAEIYLMADDATVTQLTDNGNCDHFDNFPSLSPDGKRIIFESNRLRAATDAPNTSDLFLMDTDGSHQTWLVHGSSASWSPAITPNNQGAPQSRQIVFHASASGSGVPIRIDPGAPAIDNDLFVVNVDDCLAAANCRDIATNITMNLQPDAGMAPNYNGGQLSPPALQAIDEDADWSPDGSKIVFTSHPVLPFCPPGGACNLFPDTEIYVVNSDGTGLKQLTHNGVEERAPAWSPDGSRIVYMSRIGAANAQGVGTFDLCVMSADGDGDGTAFTRLTWNAVLDASPSWSPDASQVVFHRNPPPFQLWIVKADTICANGACNCPDPFANNKCEVQLTNKPGLMSGFPRWGMLRVHVPK